MYPTIKKGTLIRNKVNGNTATVINVFTKLFRDASDWEAARHGLDCGTAATAVRVLFHSNGYEKVYKRSEVLRLFEVYIGPEMIDEAG